MVLPCGCPSVLLSAVLQLRDLVPPSASVKGPDGGDIKRPKHVVLSDTIALLRHLKEKVRAPTKNPAASLASEQPTCPVLLHTHAVTVYCCYYDTDIKC